MTSVVDKKEKKILKEETLAHLVAEREELLELCRNLTPLEWEAESLCEGWRVRDVVAHLIGLQTDWLNFLTAGETKANRRMVEKRRELSIGKLIEQLDSTVQPNLIVHLMVSGYLFDNWVHQQDIRWVLGPERQRNQDLKRLGIILASLQKTAGKKKGVCFVSSDPEWKGGEGQEVWGSAEAVIMALANRPAALSRLKGPGLTILGSSLKPEG